MVNVQNLIYTQLVAIVLLFSYVLCLWLEYFNANSSLAHLMINNLSYHLILNLRFFGSLAANPSPKAQ